MFDTAGQAFFTALRDAVERRLGRGHACFHAIDEAVAAGDAASTAAAQFALNGLDPEALTELMAETHKMLRENPAAILGAWPSGFGGAPH